MNLAFGLWCAEEKMRNIRSANLNLLPVLRMLLRHRHVTHAARSLNMSQSSVSEALGKLRHLFKDELLVTHGNSTTLTAFAQRIEPLVEKSLNSVANLLGNDIMPSGGRKSAIDIATSDYVILTIGTEIVRRVREIKPDLAVRFQEYDSKSLARLRSGDVDFVITPEVTIGTVEYQIAREMLYEDQIVCVVDENSPISERVSEEEYWASRHVFFSPRGDTFSASKTTILQQLGERKTDATLVQSYLLLPFFVEDSNAIALVQRSLAQKLALSAKVRIVEAPFDIDVRMLIAWDDSHAQDPILLWFLAMLRELLVKLQQ